MSRKHVGGGQRSNRGGSFERASGMVKNRTRHGGPRVEPGLSGVPSGDVRSRHYEPGGKDHPGSFRQASLAAQALEQGVPASEVEAAVKTGRDPRSKR